MGRATNGSSVVTPVIRVLYKQFHNARNLPVARITQSVERDHCHNSRLVRKLQTPNMNAEMSIRFSNPNSTVRFGNIPPGSIPGLRPTFNISSDNPNKSEPTVTSQSRESTPSSDENNSPTDLNSYKKIVEKPPLIKRLTMGLTGNSSGKLNLYDDNCPLFINENSYSPKRPQTGGGYVNEVLSTVTDTCKPSDSPKFTKPINQKDESVAIMRGKMLNDDFASPKRVSSISSTSSVQTESSVLSCSSTPPPLPPERIDSLSTRDENELKNAPWFQAGIPREITLELLSQKPVGAFMVRESTSKPGCFALSLRVPRDFQPSGIAHYLILRTSKGFKIKGFTKEFSSLSALITHHSVMPELLPCTLQLNRNNCQSSTANTSRDFADIDADPNYNGLNDFRKMMADLNV